jgi:O-acetyl-ADP-ribose deacetylase (regulator of RNase III)
MPKGDPLPPHSFGPITVWLVNDEIAARRADALVVAADAQLEMVGEAGATLLSRGGVEIHREAVAQAPAKMGSVVRTSAGRLSAQYAYHAVVTDHDTGKDMGIGDVSAAVRGILACALTDGVRTLAMPLLGVRAGELEVRDSLEAILETIEDVSTAYTWTVTVEIVVKAVSEFVEAAEVFRDYAARAVREAEDAQFAAEFLKLLLRKQ